MAVSALIFLALFIFAGLKIITNQQRQLHDLRERLRRISATDDEVVAILEATDTDLARRLLVAARTPVLILPPVGPTLAKLRRRRHYLTSIHWRALKLEIESCDLDEGRIDVVRSWLSRGSRVSPNQRAVMMGLFDLDVTRARVRALLDEEENRDSKREA